MLKKLFIGLSILSFVCAGALFMYLLFGNASAISGNISVREAADRWRVMPFIPMCFIAGIVFGGLAIYQVTKTGRNSAFRNFNGFYQNRHNSNGAGFHNYNNSQQQWMDEMTRQQHQQFMEESMRQHQQFVDEMNRENMEQFNQWSMNESMHSVDHNQPQGFF